MQHAKVTQLFKLNILLVCYILNLSLNLWLLLCEGQDLIFAMLGSNTLKFPNHYQIDFLTYIIGHQDWYPPINGIMPPKTILGTDRTLCINYAMLLNVHCCFAVIFWKIPQQDVKCLCILLISNLQSKL